MNIEQLRYLTAVFRTGSYSEAAQELYVTPQAVTKALKALENELGVKLVEKSGGRAVITDIGRHVCEDASAAVAIVDGIPSKVRSLSAQVRFPRELRLGISAFSMRGVALNVGERANLTAAFPMTKIDPVFSSPEGCFLAIKRGALDAAVVYGAYDFAGVASVPLGVSQMYVALTEASPLHDLDLLRLEDISGQPFIAPLDINYVYPKLLSLCSLKGIAPPGFLHQLMNPEEEREFLLAGGAMFVDSTSDVEQLVPGCRMITLQEECGLGISLSLVYRADAELPWLASLAEWLRSCILARHS